MCVCASNGVYCGTTALTASNQGRRYSSAYTSGVMYGLVTRGEGRHMANDRLTGLDASFLHLEDSRTHMHVAAVMTSDGEPPAYDDLVEAIDARLHLVPRYRQKLAFVPLSQGRPRWVDDPHFNLRYHVRMTALPQPGGEEDLKRLAGR